MFSLLTYIVFMKLYLFRDTVCSKPNKGSLKEEIIVHHRSHEEYIKSRYSL